MQALSPATQPDSSTVLTKAAVRAAALLELKGATLAKVLGVSEPTVSRIKKGETLIEPGSREGESALLLIRLYRSLDALVSNDGERRKQWLRSYNRAFNAVPRDYMQTVEGLVRTVTYLDGIRAAI
ncbi:MAG: MbcA/ParS/Xre antitoxin family protein [Candidatus Protistobacter heckmanni]|nr:MbcA/ParS/Xre antitoxin family protein [Candidatus Protistobacter heckmanni]